MVGAQAPAIQTPKPRNGIIMMKYFVESNNGFGPFGVIKEFDDYKEAVIYAVLYSRKNQVRTKVTTI